MWLINILPLILQSFANMIADWLLWFVVILVALQYRKLAGMKEEFFGLKGESVTQLTAVSLVYGLIAGLIGSMVMLTVGISINQIGIAYLWPLAILLMLINIRFLCFSYAGGIISLAYLVFGYPEVEVPQLMALVALLHLIEAILIYANGYHEAIPVYTRNASGKLVGGYLMQKFWPIPIVVLVMIALQSPDYAKNGVEMPEWWPLLKTNIDAVQDKMQYVPFAVAAALGYGDVALTSLPKEKSRISSFYLLLYSLILLFLSIAASHILIFAWAAALFGPIGHELVIKFGKDNEINGKPLFYKEMQGLRIFEIVSNSPAERNGFNRGDLLLSVNGYAVNSKQDFANAVAELPWLIEVEYIPYKHTVARRINVRKNIVEAFGVIFPPESWERPNVELGTPNLYKRLIQKIFKR